MSARSVTESLQISEVEAESGDCVSKLDYSGDSPSRPNSDIADVSLEQPRAFASILGFLVQVLYVWVVLCIVRTCRVSVMYRCNGLRSAQQKYCPEKTKYIRLPLGTGEELVWVWVFYPGLDFPGTSLQANKERWMPAPFLELRDYQISFSCCQQ